MFKSIFILLNFLILFYPSEINAEKILRIGVVSVPQDLGNPYGTITMPTILASLGVFDSLTSLDKNGNVKPWIAEKWEYLDKFTWHFRIKPNIKFSNGEKLSSEELNELIELQKKFSEHVSSRTIDDGKDKEMFPK